MLRDNSYRFKKMASRNFNTLRRYSPPKRGQFASCKSSSIGFRPTSFLEVLDTHPSNGKLYTGVLRFHVGNPKGGSDIFIWGVWKSIRKAIYWHCCICLVWNPLVQQQGDTLEDFAWCKSVVYQKTQNKGAKEP